MFIHKNTMSPSITHMQSGHYHEINNDTMSEQRPPKWKMFLLTFPAAYILSTMIVIPLLTLLPGWPFIAINLIVNILLAFLLTYVALPFLTRLFHSWLYRRMH